MKTAWIFPGGSARAVYTAGVMYALGEMKLPKPDILIGCSGSAPTSLCYVADQKETIRDIWCESLPDNRKFLSFLRFWRMLDVNYLIDEVFKKGHPLNIEGIKNSPTHMYLPVTDSNSGELFYFSNKDDVDMYEVSKAAVSVPVWTNLFSFKGVLINDKYYSDLPPSARYQLHVQKALQEGAQRIVIFDNYHEKDNPTGYFFSKFFIYLRNNKFKRRQLNYFREIENFRVPSNVDFILFKPETKLGMSRWNDKKNNTIKIFNRGYQETIDNNKLKKLYESREN
jgi:predicted patatin/cPLA2 family phospholipase